MTKTSPVQPRNSYVLSALLRVTWSGWCREENSDGSLCCQDMVQVIIWVENKDSGSWGGGGWDGDVGDGAEKARSGESAEGTKEE